MNCSRALRRPELPRTSGTGSLRLPAGGARVVVTPGARFYYVTNLKLNVRPQRAGSGSGTP